MRLGAGVEQELVAAGALVRPRRCGRRPRSARPASAGSRGWARAPTAPGRGPSSRCDAAGRGCGGSRRARRRRPSRRRRRRPPAPPRRGWPRRAATRGGVVRRRARRRPRRQLGGGRVGGQRVGGGPAIRSRPGSESLMEEVSARRVLTSLSMSHPAPAACASAAPRRRQPLAGPLRAVPRLLHDPGRLDDRVGRDAGDHRGPRRRRERGRLGDQRLPAGLRRAGADHRSAR